MPARAAVKYQKQDGFLTISNDNKYVFYTPATPPDASPSTTIAVADITNLQKTPATSAKVALKVLVKEEVFLFYFTNGDNARDDRQAIEEVLSNAIAANNAAATSKITAARPAATGETGQPAAMAIASAARSKQSDDYWYDDDKLKADSKLQRSLIDSNPALRERQEQALRDKPDSLPISQFNAQFWSTRVHLLRAHAIERDQKQGDYNVLPEIGFKRVKGDKEGEEIKQLNITGAQVKLIFRQYPVVREAYDENVPPMDPGQFWTRFFNSRLLKKLKGEKVTPHDPADAILDKYLERRDAGPASIAHIPHFIDLEGNEQNHSQRKGNRPDETMRPSSFDKVPILRVLNNLSEKMLSHVAPEDGEAHAPVGLDEATFEQLRLRDLANDDKDNRVILNIRDQQHIGSAKDSNAAAEAQAYARQDPTRVLAALRHGLQSTNFNTNRLDEAIGFDPNEDSDDDEDTAMTNGHTNGHTKTPRIGSKSAMSTATSNVLSTVAQKRSAASTDPKAKDGLSEDTFTALTTTQNTTIEFLHYFWTVYLSGDASRAGELGQLVQTLDRSVDRINSVGTTADQEKAQQIDRLKLQVEAQYRRTGKRARYDFDSIAGGGRKVVDTMIKPTIAALKQAESVYRRTLEEQSVAAQAVT